jgi:hypothetical protein
MPTAIREFDPSPIRQGANERIAYKLTTTPWGSSPTSPVVKIFDQTGVDKSSTNLSGSPSVTGDVITTPLVIALQSSVQYKLTINFVVSGNTMEAYGYIAGDE